jgi:hypothetical protein
MTLREHAAKTGKYWLWVALVSIVVLPIWFSAWWLIGFPPGGDASELDSTAERISQILGISFHAILAPAQLLLRHVRIFPDSTSGAAFYWLATLLVVSAFWATVIYVLVQLYRYVRLRHAKA